MAEGQKSQLSEEEKIARKAKLLRMISNILIGISRNRYCSIYMVCYAAPCKTSILKLPSTHRNSGAN